MKRQPFFSENETTNNHNGFMDQFQKKTPEDRNKLVDLIIANLGLAFTFILFATSACATAVALGYILPTIDGGKLFESIFTSFPRLSIGEWLLLIAGSSIELGSFFNEREIVTSEKLLYKYESSFDAGNYSDRIANLKEDIEQHKSYRKWLYVVHFVLMYSLWSQIVITVNNDPINFDSFSTSIPQSGNAFVRFPETIFSWDSLAELIVSVSFSYGLSLGSMRLFPEAFFKAWLSWRKNMTGFIDDES